MDDASFPKYRVPLYETKTAKNKDPPNIRLQNYTVSRNVLVEVPAGHANPLENALWAVYHRAN